MPLPVPSPTDRELLNEIRQRSEEALESLYDRYAGMVYAVCLRVLDDEHAAEAELTEVFRELWECPDHSARNEGDVLSVLLHRARCRSVARLRQLSERTRAVKKRRGQSANGLASSAGPAHEHDQDQDQPAAAWLAAMRFESRMAVSTLSAEQRIALELSFYEGLTLKESARRLNTTVAAVRRRIHAGTRRLRRMSCDADSSRFEVWSLM